MKKLIIAFALLAFVAAGSIGFAADKKVKRCADGKIKSVTAADCAKAKGKVLKAGEKCGK